MKLLFLLFAIIFLRGIIFSQAIYFKPKIVCNMGLFNFQRRSEVKEVDFIPNIFGLQFTLGGSVIYKNKKGNSHNINADFGFLGGGYQINNKIRQDNNLLGFISNRHLINGVTPGLLGYSFSKQFKKYSSVKQKNLRFAYSLGIAYGINQSKKYYDEQIDTLVKNNYLFSSGNFLNIEERFKTKNNGLFITLGLNTCLYSKRNKTIVDIELFFNLGLRQMMYHTISYKYGYNNLSPEYTRTVKNQPIRSRGTTMGFKLGFPITIKKVNKNQ
jgi:hypothetical protein